ncbi:MAG: SDR family NAD(P)-dependent oxidoreductase, partial [Pseudomonadota bacterium]
LDRIRAGEPILRDDQANPGNRIHVDDLAAVCLRAADTDVPAGIYNVGDGDHRSSSWFTAETARQAKLPAPPEIDRDEASRVFSPMRLSFLNESRRIDTTRLRDTMGFTPRYADATDGIRASLTES